MDISEEKQSNQIDINGNDKNIWLKHNEQYKAMNQESHILNFFHTRMKRWKNIYLHASKYCGG